MIKIFEPFIKLLFPKPLSVIPFLAPLAGTLATTALGGVGAAAGAGAAAGIGAGAAGGAGILSGLFGKNKLPNILGTVLGAGQQVAGAAKGRRAQQLMPPAEDPEMRQFLSEIQRKRKQLATGVAFQPQAEELRKQQVQTQRNVLRLSGGAGGAAIAGTTRAQRATGAALGEVAERAGQREMFLTQLAGKTISDISQRRLELQLLQRAQTLAESAQLKSTGMSNIMAGIAGGFPLKAPAGTTTPTSVSAGATTQGGKGVSFEQLKQLLAVMGQGEQT